MTTRRTPIPFLISLLTFGAAAIGGGVSCSGEGATAPVPPSPVAPTFSGQPSSLTVALGEPATFAVVVAGNPAPTLEWRRNGATIAGAVSSSYTIAPTSMTDSGVVVTVVASNSAGSVSSADAVLTVTRSVSTIEVVPAVVNLYVGQASELAATLKDGAGGTMTGRPVSWESSDTSVAGVSSAGLVNAKKAGTATITAASEGKKGTSTVTVFELFVPVAAMKVSPPGPIPLAPGESVQLSVEILDCAGRPISGRAVVWSSSDNEVATVSTTGLVTAVKIGTATISVTTTGGASGTTEIRVAAPAAPAP